MYPVQGKRPPEAVWSEDLAVARTNPLQRQQRHLSGEAFLSSICCVHENATVLDSPDRRGMGFHSEGKS